MKLPARFSVASARLTVPVAFSWSYWVPAPVPLSSTSKLAPPVNVTLAVFRVPEASTEPGEVAARLDGHRAANGSGTIQRRTSGDRHRAVQSD